LSLSIQIFAKDKVQYAGQPVGLIVAESSNIANSAAKLVKINYSNVEQGIYTLKDGIKRAVEEGGLDKLITTTVKSSKSK
jgi:xanthine dehydrogenase molybdopterin-binding subunit B